MTTHRRYYFELPGEVTEGHDKLRDWLRRTCEGRWWYNEPIVEGQPFNRLAFSVTVSGRDQWFVHKRAMALARDGMFVIGLRERDVPEPIWEPLGPDGLRWRVPAEGQAGGS